MLTSLFELLFSIVPNISFVRENIEEIYKISDSKKVEIYL